MKIQLSKQLKEAYELHQKRKHIQHQHWNYVGDNLNPNAVRITLDFKEKVKFQSGPRQVSKQWFSFSLRSLLGVHITFPNGKVLIIDFISDTTSQVFFWVQCALQQVLQHERLKNVTHFEIFSDGGKSFKNKEMVYYLLEQHLASKSMTWNIFGEYHGKSVCDSHFARISDIICKHTTSVGEISSSEQLKQVIIDGFKRYRANNYVNVGPNIRDKDLAADIEVHVLDVPTVAAQKHTLEFEGINSFFQFSINNGATREVISISFEKKEKNKNTKYIRKILLMQIS